MGWIHTLLKGITSLLCILFLLGITMGVWAKENEYNTLIKAYGSKYKVPHELIKAIIAKESSFRPKAYKSEPRIKDASRGLMQLLERTARNLGYTGHIKHLFTPAINIRYGTKLLAENLKRSNGNVDIAVSAYNAGWSKIRPKDAKRKRNGEFINQEYVDDVKVYNAYFSKRITEEETKQYLRTKNFKFITTPVFFYSLVAQSILSQKGYLHD